MPLSLRSPPHPTALAASPSGSSQEEMRELEQQHELAQRKAANEGRRADEATRQAQTEKSLAAAAIKRAEAEAQRAAAVTAVAAAAAAARGGGGGGGEEGEEMFYDSETTFEGFALREAAAENSEQMVNQQLDRGAAVDEVDPQSGHSALLIACEAGHVAAARALMDRDANLVRSMRGGAQIHGLSNPLARTTCHSFPHASSLMLPHRTRSGPPLQLPRSARPSLCPALQLATLHPPSPPPTAPMSGA